MTRGPLAGKEFLVFKDTMRLGASPRSDIYLFNDDEVAEQHAILRATGDTYELENLSELYPVEVNGRPIKRSRLRHGDQIGLGRTLFSFNCKRRD
jgi:pSer/pThr/pTyr-binding forkhead associated (FHA) protein